MFVAEEEYLDVGFKAARVRLANMLRSGALITSSAKCYEEGLLQVRPLGSALDVSKLVKVQFGELVIRVDSARVPLRWVALGPEGGLFPALDADLGLTALGRTRRCSAWRVPIVRLRERTERCWTEPSCSGRPPPRSRPSAQRRGYHRSPGHRS
jgi:hypothetical protein